MWKKSIFNTVKNLLNISYTTKYLGRWSSSIDKKQWKMYADFANYDNCCCSFTNYNASGANVYQQQSQSKKLPDIKS